MPWTYDGWAPQGSTTTASTMSPGMIVRFGSARITASSTSSSTTTRSPAAARAASFLQPESRVSGAAEHELAGAAGRDHLVADHIGRDPGEGQVALALANDLVPRGERDQVREALDRDGVAVAHDITDRVGHRCDFRGGHG